MERLYRALWTRIGGRPWTYIWRESAHKKPLTWIIGMFFAGLFIGSWLTPGVGIGAIVTAAVALVLGHLFWDTHGSYHKDRQDFE